MSMPSGSPMSTRRRAMNNPSPPSPAPATVTTSEQENYHENPIRTEKLFTEEDEIRLLKALSKHITPLKKQHSSTSTTVDAAVIDRIEKSLGPKFTHSQVSDKIRRLRAKYRKQARTKSHIKTPHDRKFFDIARSIWGIKKGLSPSSTPKEEGPDRETEQESAAAEGGGGEGDGGVELGNFPFLVEECERCCFPGNGVWREGLRRLKEDKLRVMNDKLVMLKLEEANLLTKKAELTQELTRLILEAVGVASSSESKPAATNTNHHH